MKKDSVGNSFIMFWLIFSMCMNMVICLTNMFNLHNHDNFEERKPFRFHYYEQFHHNGINAAMCFSLQNIHTYDFKLVVTSSRILHDMRKRNPIALMCTRAMYFNARTKIARRTAKSLLT